MSTREVRLKFASFVLFLDLDLAQRMPFICRLAPKSDSKHAQNIFARSATTRFVRLAQLALGCDPQKCIRGKENLTLLRDSFHSVTEIIDRRQGSGAVNWTSELIYWPVSSSARLTLWGTLGTLLITLLTTCSITASVLCFASAFLASVSIRELPLEFPSVVRTALPAICPLQGTSTTRP